MEIVKRLFWEASEEKHSKIKKICRENGMTITEWIKEAVDEKLKREDYE